MTEKQKLNEYEKLIRKADKLLREIKKVLQTRVTKPKSGKR